jgi:cytochrome c2
MRKFGIFLLAAAAAMAFADSKKSGLKPGDPDKGKAVFEQCAVCHNPDNEVKKVGPGLKGLFKRAKLHSTGKKVNEENVLSRINEGGGGMPAFAEMLTDQEKTDLIAYLETL